jgi:type II secretory pathway pseudopilin PulG
MELLITVAIVGVIAAIAVPILLPVIQNGNHSSAKNSLRAIHTAEGVFLLTCGGAFTSTLDDLAKAPRTEPGQPPAQPFIGAELARNGIEHSGYRFRIEKAATETVYEVSAPACIDNEAPLVSEFIAYADPVSKGPRGGTWYFAISASGGIYQLQMPIPNPIPPSTPTAAP